MEDPLSIFTKRSLGEYDPKLRNLVRVVYTTTSLHFIVEQIDDSKNLSLKFTARFAQTPVRQE